MLVSVSNIGSKSSNVAVVRIVITQYELASKVLARAIFGINIETIAFFGRLVVGFVRVLLCGQIER